MKQYVCPDCGGDGKETCHNPDHGFIKALVFHDVGRIGCPVCGHDPNGKACKGDKCESCGGAGVVDLETAENIIFSYDLDCEPIEVLVKEQKL